MPPFPKDHPATHNVCRNPEHAEYRTPCCCYGYLGCYWEEIGMSGEPELNAFAKEISEKNGTPRNVAYAGAGIEEYEARQNEIKPCAVCDTSKITRVEVINHAHLGKGREFVIWQEGLKVTLDLQDDGRTLKVFLSSTQDKV